MQRLGVTLALLTAVAACVLLLVPDTVHAANFGQGALPYEQPLSVIRQSVTGPIAFTMSVIGIVIAGIALVFGGDLGGFIRQMVMLVLAISVVVGATNLMGSLFGQGAVISARSSAEPAVEGPGPCPGASESLSVWL